MIDDALQMGVYTLSTTMTRNGTRSREANISTAFTPIFKKSSSAFIMEQEGLTDLQKVYFWLGFLGPMPSIALYVCLPAGTVEYFGGTPSPTAIFWCTIAASGDAIFSAMSWAVLSHPTNLVLRQSVLWANALYSVFHFGGFLRAHFTMEPHPHGLYGYMISVIISWAAYLAWGRGYWQTTDQNQARGKTDALQPKRQS